MDKMTSPAMNTPPSDEMRDALDHIMRVARATMQPTRRLDWIALRAKYAIEGKQWSRDVAEEPRDRVAADRNLRARLKDAEARAARMAELLRELLDDNLKQNADLAKSAGRKYVVISLPGKWIDAALSSVADSKERK